MENSCAINGGAAVGGGGGAPGEWDLPGADRVVRDAPVGICTVDASGVVRSWNPASERIVGRSAADVVGRRIAEVLPADEKELGGPWGLLLLGEPLEDIEIVGRSLGGATAHLAVSAVPLRDDRSGLTNGGVVVVADVAERKRIEAEHQQFAALAENSTEFVALLGLDGTPRYLNPAGRAMVGMDAVMSLFDLGPSDLFTPETGQLLASEAIPAVRAGRAWDGELLLHNLIDGSERAVRGSLFPICDPTTGQPTLLAASLRDITDLKRSESAIRRRDAIAYAAAAATACLLNQPDLGSAIEEAVARFGRATGVDRVRVMTCCDGEARPFCGWSASPEQSDSRAADAQVVPESWRIEFAAGRAVHGLTAEFPDDARAGLALAGVLAALLVPVTVEGRTWGYAAFEDFRWPRQWADAEAAILVASCRTMGAAIARFQAEGRLILSNEGLTASLERQAALGRELAEAKAAAEQASRSKSEFLANMSHEIRTPMTAILGYADLLVEDEPTPADRASHLNAIRQNGRHLLALINDILDISKIEAGRMEVEQVACSPREVIGEATDMMRGRAAEKGLDFEVRYLTPVPPTIRTDPTRVRQVVVNLVGNAIKFTPAGSVVLDVEVPRAASGEGRLRLTVRDTGIGLTAEQVGRLFGAFRQADTSTARKFGGTGLGLYICKRLARMMGGDLTVTSEHGRGSAFSLDVPVGPIALVEGTPTAAEVLPASAPPRGWAHFRLSGRHLVADDGPDNRRLVSMYLRRAGADVEVVGDGRAAVDRVLGARAAGAPFKAVVMDVQMPELDGYSAVRELRAAGVGTPVVALTAHAMARDRERCLQAGFTAYATKPIDRAKLLETLAALPFEPADGSAASAPAGPREQVTATPGPTAGDPVTSDLAADPEFLELVQLFTAALPGTAAGLRRCVADRDRAGLCSLIHRVKGSSGSFGFMGISLAAGAVEAAVSTEGDWTVVDREVEPLIGMFRRVAGYRIEKEAA